MKKNAKVGELEHEYRGLLSGLYLMLKGYAAIRCVARSRLDAAGWADRARHLAEARSQIRHAQGAVAKARPRVPLPLSNWTRRREREIERMVVANFLEDWRRE